MGRKGDSKRKPSQPKSKPLSSDNASGSVSSIMKAVENQPVKSVATPSADRKKKTK